MATVPLSVHTQLVERLRAAAGRSEHIHLRSSGNYIAQKYELLIKSNDTNALNDVGMDPAYASILSRYLVSNPDPWLQAVYAARAVLPKEIIASIAKMIQWILKDKVKAEEPKPGSFEDLKRILLNPRPSALRSGSTDGAKLGPISYSTRGSDFRPAGDGKTLVQPVAVSTPPSATAGDGPDSAEPATGAAENPASDGSRYFNVSLNRREDGAALPSTQPLLVGREYALRVQIGESATGLGRADKFADAALTEVWRHQDAVPITVVVAAQNLRIVGEAVQVMDLPRQGGSPVVSFTLRVEVPPEAALPLHARIWVQLFLLGYFLQSKEIQAAVYASDVGPVPDALTARRLEATVAKLSHEELGRLPKRTLTVNLVRTAEDTVGIGVLDLYGVTGRSGLSRSYINTKRPKEDLLAAIAGLRGVLRGMVAGDTDELGEQLPGYIQVPAKDYEKPAPPSLMQKWLPQLAAAGHALHTLLFRDASAAADAPALATDELRPGTVIQINQHAALLSDVTVPWSLLYPRRPPSSLSEARICPSYAEPERRDCTGCPNRSDERTVCPLGFWGFRYALEQLPGWSGPPEPGHDGPTPGRPGEPERPIAPLLRTIPNKTPIRLNLVVFPQFPRWTEHQRAIESIGQSNIRIELINTGKVSAVESLWDAKADELDLIDFYVHGGSDKVANLPMLLLGAQERVQPHLLEKYESRPWARGPLVLLNGCATADYRSHSYASLVAGFRRAGASGVVATECLIFEALATEYTRELLRRLLAGQPLGPAMLETRRYFLQVRNNPLGLVYVCYAAHEVALAQPVPPSPSPPP